MINFYTLHISKFKIRFESIYQEINEINNQDNIVLFFDTISTYDLPQLVKIDPHKFKQQFMNLLELCDNEDNEDYLILLQQFSCLNILPFQTFLESINILSTLFKNLPKTVLIISNLIIQLQFSSNHLQNISENLQIQLVNILLQQDKSYQLLEDYGFMVLQAIRQNPNFIEFIALVQDLLQYDNVNTPFSVQILSNLYEISVFTLLQAAGKFKNRIIFKILYDQLQEYKQTPEIFSQFLQLFIESFSVEYSQILSVLIQSITYYSPSEQSYFSSRIDILDEQILIFALSQQIFQQDILQFLFKLAVYNIRSPLIQRLRGQNLTLQLSKMAKNGTSLILQQLFFELDTIDFFDEMQRELLLIYLAQ